MNVVAVPIYDNTKMRVRSYLPVAVVNPDEDGIILNELDTQEIATEYYQEQIKQLDELIKGNVPKEIKEHSITQELSPVAIKILNKKLVDIPSVLRNRIVNTK